MKTIDAKPIYTDSDTDHLPFFSLKNTSRNFRQALLPADDGISPSIEVPGGFAFDNTSQSTVYVRATA